VARGGERTSSEAGIALPLCVLTNILTPIEFSVNQYRPGDAVRHQAIAGCKGSWQVSARMTGGLQLKPGLPDAHYDYLCPANGRVVEVSHKMAEQVYPWGELCRGADLAWTARRATQRSNA